LSHVIILFSKHINSRVFWCNSQRNHANRQRKTPEYFRKIINEDSRGHGRLYTKGGILFPSPKTSYMEVNTQKDEETCIYAMEIILGHPEHTETTLMPLACARARENQSIIAFCYCLVEKSRFLSPTSGGNSPYKYHSSHS
jgi:hypothetical protein